jgi:hypothetical protein
MTLRIDHRLALRCTDCGAKDDPGRFRPIATFETQDADGRLRHRRLCLGCLASRRWHGESWRRR